MHIPFLSTMMKYKRVASHSDADGQYVITVRPNVGLVAAFGLTLFADQAWPEDEVESEDYRRSDVGVRQAQRLKCEHPLVLAELMKIRDMAVANKVPREHVLLVDCACSQHNPDEVAAAARDIFENDGDFRKLRSNALWPRIHNRVGLALTDLLIDERWDWAPSGI